MLKKKFEAYVVSIVKDVVEHIIVGHIKEFVAHAFAISFDPERVMMEDTLSNPWFSDKDASRVGRAIRMKTRQTIKDELGKYIDQQIPKGYSRTHSYSQNKFGDDQPRIGSSSPHHNPRSHTNNEKPSFFSQRRKAGNDGAQRPNFMGINTQNIQ